MSFNPALLNQNSVKKFVDRLEKVYAQRLGDKNVKRTQVYEDVANLFGYDSWYNMDQAMKNAGQNSFETSPSNQSTASPSAPSAVLHLLQNTPLKLTDDVLWDQVIGVLQSQTTEDLLQSCREIERFLKHNRDDSKLRIKVTQKMQHDCPEVFQEAREEIINIFSGNEYLDYFAQTAPPEKEEQAKSNEYLSSARVVMKRLDYIAKPFVSKETPWTFQPLADQQPTSVEQIDGVLKIFKGELEKMPVELKKAEPVIKYRIQRELMKYVYGQHGILYRAQSRHPEHTKYSQTSDVIEKALDIKPTPKLK